VSNTFIFIIGLEMVALSILVQCLFGTVIYNIYLLSYNIALNHI